MFNIKQINHATSNQRDRKIQEDLSAHLKRCNHFQENGEVTSFEAISGSLKGIELKEHEFENEVADNAAQMNWIKTLVDRINAKLTEPVSVTEASDEDDLPEEFYN